MCISAAPHGHEQPKDADGAGRNGRWGWKSLSEASYELVLLLLLLLPPFFFLLVFHAIMLRWPGLVGGLVRARAPVWEEEASDGRGGGGGKRSRICVSIEDQGETCTDDSVKQKMDH